MLESTHEHPNAVIRVLHAKDAIVGYSIAVYAADECELLSIAIHPHHRRSGLASELCRDLVKEATVRGSATVFLEVRTSNEAARAFYAAMGYEVVAQRKRYYQDGEDALIMRLNLGEP